MKKRGKCNSVIEISAVPLRCVMCLCMYVCMYVCSRREREGEGVRGKGESEGRGVYALGVREKRGVARRLFSRPLDKRGEGTA